MKSQTYLIKITICLITALAFISSASAKNSGTIKGVVLDEEKAVAPFATIIVYTSSDSTLYKGETADQNGSFKIEGIKDGKYYLVVQMIGMGKAIKSNIQIDELNQLVDLGEIILKQEANNLETVTIVAEKPFIERTIDKTVVNVENSIVQANSTVSEVLEKLPGVIVDRDGNIRLKGKQGVIVMIDGKPTGLTGQDLNNMLKSMSAGNIQKIEIITNPSSKYDAAGNAGIINIVMKKNRKVDLNGNVNIGIGQGRYTKINNGFNLNYKDKWYNLFAYYTYSNQNNFTNLVLNRKFYNGDSLKEEYQTNDYIFDQTESHSPRIGADFNLSKKTTLSFLGTSQITSDNFHADDRTDVLNGMSDMQYYTHFINSSKFKYYNYAINSELKTNLDTNGREIKFNMDYAKYWDKTSQLFETKYQLPDQTILHKDILVGDHFRTLSLYSAKIDYTHPLKKNATFETGLKSSYVSSDNNMNFYNSIVSDSNYDSKKSSHFVYSENINAGYINFNKKFEKLSLQLGLRAENTTSEGKQLLNEKSFNRNYFQLFPTLFAEYKVNDKNTFSLNVGRRINRPAFDQLNPFRKLIDPTTYTQGNPYLLPQTSYNSEASYVFNNCFFVSLGYSRVKDCITEVLVQDPVTKTTYQSVINLDKFIYTGLDLTYSKKLTNWWNTNTNLVLYNGIYQGKVNNNEINKTMPSFYMSTNNNFFINEGLSIETSFSYNYKNFYGVTIIKPSNNFSIGIQKSVLKKQGSLTLNVTDIFYNSFSRGTTEFGTVVENWAAKRDTRIIKLSFSYKFGNGQLSSIRKNSGADDEKNRVR